VSPRLADPSVRAALELVAELPAAGDADRLRVQAVRAVARLVCADLVCWYDWDPQTGALAVVAEPGGAVAPQAALEIAATFRGQGEARELAVDVPAGHGVACIAVYRHGRAFDASERALLAVARASVVTAQRVLARRPAPRRWNGVTARESEVLETLAAGLTPTQAARRLQISPRTVHKHLEHAYRKLGVTHLAAAIAAVGPEAQVADLAAGRSGGSARRMPR
jgi:DNA-binding CsgD family transcriptional regulator